VVASSALLVGVLVSAQGTAPTRPRRVEILFVGSTSTQQRPDSSRLASTLKAALAQYGFNFSYTTDAADLNAASLAQYDALMIRAHRDAITPAQEKAVLDFVAGGKGVLMERADAERPQSWTRVGSQGKGRVVYVAYGEDEQAWSSANLHTQIKDAIMRAVGPDVTAHLAALKIQALRHTDGIVPVPNYERRTPAPKLQRPLSADEAAKHFQVPPGFKLQLFAAEPLITGNPEAMAWDERGRLWIAETKDYPNNPQASGQGNDVIKILEDTNRDGRADKATIFADKLSIVSSLVFVNGGIVVAQAGELVALKDTNGDDKADLRESLIRGWGMRDTHALASNLKYGLDNWIWGAVGYSGYNGTVGGQALNFNQALYRFARDARQMEHMASFTNNTWGLAFNEDGDVFGNTANGEHSNYVAIPRPYYQGVTGLRADGKKKIDGHYAMHANTPKIRQVDVQGGFTAAAGHNFYTARAFPEEYWNRVAFVNEPTGHVVHRAIIERAGSGFAEKDGWNIAASDDEWFAPVHAEVGPDGALWLLDFYDFIIQHNPTPIGPIAQGYQYLNGRGNAYDSPLREHDRGRIYRLVWKRATPYKPLSLSASEPAGLTAALRHENMFWRLTAQRLLVERGKTDVVPQLIAIVTDRTVDKIGLNSPAVHALWTMHGLGVLDGKNAQALDAAKQALTHPAAGVRKAAQSVLPKTAQSVTDLLSAGALHDKDLNVRLNALLALSQMPASAGAGRAIYLSSKETDVIEDEWLPEAIWIAATRHQDGFLQAYANEVGLAEFMRIGVRGAHGERVGGLDWSAPGLDDAGWTSIPAPKIWSETPLGEHVGTIWFRRTIDLPAEATGKLAVIRLGIVDDTDVTYINGIRINATANSRNLPRQYTIPAGVLIAGRNVIAVRISNVNGRGGFVPDPAPAPGVAPLTGALTGMVIAGEGFNVSLAGEWRAKIEETWEGARRRDIVQSVPIAEQFLLANSSTFAPVGAPMDKVVAPGGASVDKPAVAPGGALANKPVAAATATPSTVVGANDTLKVTLSVIVGQMKFDQTTITARAGQHVEITFTNTDDMAHNIVIFKRGTMATYEKELFGSMNEPNAQLRGFVPDSPNVLFASRLLNAGESTVLAFDAPAEPGEYPFLCSFPGHWLTMRGLMRVD
jgi:putative membrane-bound dehydrogenase-like protein